jgi:hypothetical protein
MNLFRVTAGAAILWFACVPNISAQVRVTVPEKSFMVTEKITATVLNDSDQPVTLCVESGQISKSGPTAVSTPVPFTIEGRVLGKWKVLMVSPPGAGERNAAVLEAKKSLEFPFWPPTKGELRLQMRYWQGAHANLDCANPPPDSHSAKDTSFAVHSGPK